MKLQLLFLLIKKLFIYLNEMVEEYTDSMYNNETNAKKFYIE